MENNNNLNTVKNLIKIKDNITNLKLCMSETIDQQQNICVYEDEAITRLKNSYYQILKIDELKKYIKDIDYLIELTNNEIDKECCHEIIYDYIDTFPERSLPIKYCQKCFLTIE